MADLLREELARHDGPLPADACRLFHGRGHCFDELSFITVDWLSPVVRAVIYGERDAHTVAQIERAITGFADSHREVEAVSLQHRHRGSSRQHIIHGTLPAACFARERGLRFELDLEANQNIGFFLDASPARDWVYRVAAGRRVLNLFAYTCAFSVAALAGGAEHVDTIDLSRPAIAAGRRNHAHNDLDASRATFLPHDVFRSTRKLETLGPYELVIIDPPSRQKGSFEADKDYARLLDQLPPWLAAGADILACLNAPYLDEHFLPELFERKLPHYQLAARLPQREDFPERDPARCLKMQVFTAGA